VDEPTVAVVPGLPGFLMLEVTEIGTEFEHLVETVSGLTGCSTWAPLPGPRADAGWCCAIGLNGAGRSASGGASGSGRALTPTARPRPGPRSQGSPLHADT
jgi:hypothetical protein